MTTKISALSFQLLISPSQYPNTSIKNLSLIPNSFLSSYSLTPCHLIYFFVSLAPFLTDSQQKSIIYNQLCLVTQLCPILCDPMDYSPPGSSVHGHSPDKNTGVSCHVVFSKESSQPRKWTQVSPVACRFFTIWVTREAHMTRTDMKSLVHSFLQAIYI